MCADCSGGLASDNDDAAAAAAASEAGKESNGHGCDIITLGKRRNNISISERVFGCGGGHDG